jgi:hypothetical protein
MHDLSSKVVTVSDRMHTDSTPGRILKKNMPIFNIKHELFILYQTFGNIYTIAAFCKHALRVFHAIVVHIVEILERIS